MPFPPARHDHVDSDDSHLSQKMRCFDRSGSRERGKSAWWWQTERRRTLGGWRKRRKVLNATIDRSLKKIKKPLPTCLFLNHQLPGGMERDFLSLVHLQGKYSCCVWMLDAMSRNEECEEDRSGEGWGDCYFACCADIGCQNTNNQYSRRHCYDGAWNLVVLKINS